MSTIERLESSVRSDFRSFPTTFTRASGVPTDRPRPPRQAFEGARVRRALDAAQTAALDRLAREQRVTLNMQLLAAFATLMGRWSGQADLVIGTPVANRGHEGSAFDLTLNLRRHAGHISVIFEYDAALFDGPTIERLADSFAVLLGGLVDAPDARLMDLPWVPAEHARRAALDRDGRGGAGGAGGRRGLCAVRPRAAGAAPGRHADRLRAVAADRRAGGRVGRGR